MRFLNVLKKTVACFLCVAMSMTMFVGCEDKNEFTSTTATNGSSSDSDSSSSQAEQGNEIYKEGSSIEDYPICLDETSGYTDMVNYTLPEKGEEIVVMTIKDKGTIKIKLFPELLPRACANFVALAKQGYYDGLIFHRIIADFMIQGGDPLGTGYGGECIWGTKFDGGYSKYLCHVAGALAYANSGSTATNGSQFYITVGQKFPAEATPMYSAFDYTDTALKAYEEDGGYPPLDGGYTVFGQVFEGLDLVVDICNNTVTSGSDRPVEDVIIEKVEVVQYEG